MSAGTRAGDARARERAQLQPLPRDLRLAAGAPPVGADGDPREGGVDLVDGDLQVGAAALRDGVRDGLRALGEGLLTLADAVGAVLVEQGAEAVPRTGRRDRGVEAGGHAELLRANAEGRGHRWWRVRTGGSDSGGESGDPRWRPVLAAGKSVGPSQAPTTPVHPQR